MVLHRPCHMESWVGHCVDTDFNMTLLNIHHSVLDGLCHLHPLHKNGESAPSKGAYVDFLASRQALPSVYDAHLE